MTDDLQPEAFNEEENTDAPKKRITRRKISAPRPKAFTEEIAEAELVPKELVPATDRPMPKKEINDFLTNLYQDENGHIPSMQSLTMKKSNTFFKTLVGLIGVCVIGASLLWMGFFMFPSGQNVADSQVSITIQGVSSSSLGATTTYSIIYSNNSDTELKNVVVNAYYPEGFIFKQSSPAAANAGNNEWKLGSLSARAHGTIQVTGLPFGSMNDPKSWRVFINYTPTNFNSELQKAATLTTVIADSPVTLSISGPDKIAVGSPTSYTIAVQVEDGFKLPIQIVPELPKNFTLTSAVPKLNAGGLWPITFSTSSTSTAPTAPRTFTVQGTYTAGQASSTPMRAYAYLPSANKQNYQIASAQLTSELIKNEVNINMAINGAVSDFDTKPGDMLNMTVRVKNSSATEIKNAVVKLALTAPAIGKNSLLQWSEINDKYDGDILGEQISNTVRKGTLSWSSKKIPALAKLKPNDEVTIDVQIPLKDAKQFDLGAITMSSSTAEASIEFTDSAKAPQKISADPIVMTLNSDISFSNDNLVGTTASGKPKHTITWTINNTFHSLKDIEVSASVFGDTTVSIDSKGAGELVYDQSQNKVIWTIPQMSSALDVLSSAFTVTVNKGDPSQSLLVSKVHITATDTVTGQKLDIGGDEVRLGQ